MSFRKGHRRQRTETDVLTACGVRPQLGSSFSFPSSPPHSPSPSSCSNLVDPSTIPSFKETLGFRIRLDDPPSPPPPSSSSLMMSSLRYETVSESCWEPTSNVLVDAAMDRSRQQHSIVQINDNCNNVKDLSTPRSFLNVTKTPVYESNCDNNDNATVNMLANSSFGQTSRMLEVKETNMERISRAKDAYTATIEARERSRTPPRRLCASFSPMARKRNLLVL